MNEYALYYWLLHRYGVGIDAIVSENEIKTAIGCIDWRTLDSARKKLMAKGLLEYQRGVFSKGGGRGRGAGRYRILRDLMLDENISVSKEPNEP